MNHFAKTIVAAMLAGAAVPAAAVVYSEDFNNPGFAGGSPFADTSDRFGPTTYYTAAAFNGWSFSSGNTFLAQSGQRDGAILLNENGGGGVASRTISGLTAGNTYALSFLLSGDNRPGSAYVLNVSVDGGPAVVFNGIDGASGSVPGVVSTFNFTASGTTASLVFAQASVTQASPIIDNIVVSAAVPEAATWMLLIAGFGMVGVAARRRKAFVAA